MDDLTNIKYYIEEKRKIDKWNILLPAERFSKMPDVFFFKPIPKIGEDFYCPMKGNLLMGIDNSLGAAHICSESPLEGLENSVGNKFLSLQLRSLKRFGKVRSLSYFLSLMYTRCYNLI